MYRNLPRARRPHLFNPWQKSKPKVSQLTIVILLIEDYDGAAPIKDQNFKVSDFCGNRSMPTRLLY
jgi:hypothetical protein